MKESDDIHQYDDIINLPHPVSVKHPQMPMMNRAAQFAPFSALTGYDSAIKEARRLTNRKVELDENEKSVLDQKLQILLEQTDMQKEVQITYFEKDIAKEGGRYLTEIGVIKRIDEYKKMMVMKNGMKIPLEDIYEIESEF